MDPQNRKILVYQPVQLWLMSAILVVVLVTLGYWLYRHGLLSAGTELVEAKRSEAQLSEQLDGSLQANRELKQQLAILERSSEIDRRAALEVRDQFAELNKELLELGKELDFYRGIVSPMDNKSGLNIQRFELLPAATERVYVYRLMLTQVRRNERYARGTVEMDVEGVRDGAVRVLPFARLASGDARSLKFKFRYFQEFTGELRVPEGFEPQRVTVRLKPSGKGQPPGIEKTMDWPP